MVVPFKLSATLSGHEDDVRTLISPSPDLIVSGSRDSTIRTWYNTSSATGINEWSDSSINYKSNKFINSLAYFNDNVEQLIVSGGNDTLVNLTSLGATLDNEPEYCFIGHESNVCCLDTYQDLVASGSWDSTAKIWSKNGELLYNLKGHDSSVWSVKFIDRDTILTCGADRTIRKWFKGDQVSKFIAHADVIRDLLLIDSSTFASCSNDGSIKIWSMNGNRLLKALEGHDSFVYSLGLLPSGELISSGEDRTVRVWSLTTGDLIQIITLPCISAWKVIVLSNGDIAVGSSDSKIRVFTRDPARVASPKELEDFETSLKNSSVNESTYDNLNKDKLPGLEYINKPGQKEGQTQMIRTALGTVEVYQWSQDKWSKIGEVVSSSSSDKRKEYMGQMYDYVFDVDIEDGKPPLKLPFNVSDSPYSAADKFLVDNDLPASYLHQIVEFILANTTGVELGQTQGSTSDEPYRDPSYSSSYRPKTEPKKSGILPQTDYLSFTTINEVKLISAFKKLNSKQPESNQLDASQFETVINMQDYSTLSQISSDIILSWDDSSKLLGFDILRSVILKIKPFENLFELIKIGLTSTDPKIVMMSLRLLTNIFSATPWGETIYQDPELIEVIFFQDVLTSINKEKLLPVTLATLLINYSVFIYKRKLSSLCDRFTPVVNKFGFELLGDEESAYRVLIAIGTLKEYKAKSGIDQRLVNKIKEIYGNVGRFTIIFNEI